MKKFVKLSLVAAVAVSGLVSTASAQSASDAIKGVSVSGYLQYRWDKDQTSSTESDFKAGTNDRSRFRLQATAKANDTVSLTARVSSGDKTVNANIDRKFITVNAGMAKIIAGTMADSSPFTDGTRVDGEVLLVSPTKGLTLAAAYYHNANGTSVVDANNTDIKALGAMGTAGIVGYNLWYATQNNTNVSATKYAFAQAIVNAGPAKIELAYSSKKVDSTNKQTQTRLVVSGKVAAISLKAALVKAGKDGAKVELTNSSSEAVSNFGSSKIDTNTAANATGAYLKIGTSFTPTIGASLEYFKIDGGKDLTAKITYKIAKNTSSYIRFSKGNKTDTAGAADIKAVRVEFKYSF